MPLPSPDPLPGNEVALLLHCDDLQPESLPLDGVSVTQVGSLLALAPRLAEPVRRADEAAMADALARASAHFGCPAVAAAEGWDGGRVVVTAWAPVGPSAEALPVGCTRMRRPWDDLVWPSAKRGYFQVRKTIPAILREAEGHRSLQQAVEVHPARSGASACDMAAKRLGAVPAGLRSQAG